MTNENFFKEMTSGEMKLFESIMDNTNLTKLEFQSKTLKNALRTMFGEALIGLYVYASNRGIAEDLQAVVEMSIDINNAVYNKDEHCDISVQEAVAIISDLNMLAYRATYTEKEIGEA